jgi:hypothetical protein
MVNGRRRGKVTVVVKASPSEVDRVDRALGHCLQYSDKEKPKNAA